MRSGSFSVSGVCLPVGHAAGLITFDPGCAFANAIADASEVFVIFSPPGS